MLAALFVPLPRAMLCRLRLLVSLDTVLRWHRDLVRSRHVGASEHRGLGRPRTVAFIRRLVLSLTTENRPGEYRRIQGELTLLGIWIEDPSVVDECLAA